jgi:hypothetical protein
LSGSCSAFSARNRFMSSCRNTPSISVSLSGHGVVQIRGRL